MKRALNGEDDSRQKKLKLNTWWELDHEAPPASSTASLFCTLIWRKTNINEEISSDHGNEKESKMLSSREL